MIHTDNITDPHLLAEIERATAPYRGLVPPHILEEMRSILIESLTEHPTGKALLKQSAPAPTVSVSGEVYVDEIAPENLPKAQSGGSR